MQQIPDITDNETWVLRTTLRERYEQEVDIQLADSEIRLRPSYRELSSCPVIYWQWEKCHFVIFKTDDKNYRCQFFMSPTVNSAPVFLNTPRSQNTPHRWIMTRPRAVTSDSRKHISGQENLFVPL